MTEKSGAALRKTVVKRALRRTWFSREEILELGITQSEEAMLKEVLLDAVYEVIRDLPEPEPGIIGNHELSEDERAMTLKLHEQIVRSPRMAELERIVRARKRMTE